MADKKQKFELGAVITEAGSSLKKSTADWRVMRPTVNLKKCIGCEICAKFCPDSAISIRNKKATINYKYCKGCGICARECTVSAIMMKEEEK